LIGDLVSGAPVIGSPDSDLVGAAELPDGALDATTLGEEA
jgi:hypothetical protein